MSDSKLSLKILINKQKSKVIFAEANRHAADVLFSFLTLPLGRIVKILEKHYGDEAPVVGSITTLYRGLSNLDSRYFTIEGAKQMLLNPRSSFEDKYRRLKLDFTDSHPTKYFVCPDSDCPHPEASNISLYPNIAICDCGKPLSTELVVGERFAAVEADHEVFTSITSCFIISDDLRVMPNATRLVQTLSDLGITECTDGAELRSLNLGMKNVMDLLKCALISKTPLTDVFINGGDISTSAAEYIDTTPYYFGKSGENSVSLKVLLQKSTDKFLFAHAKYEFLEILFSFLTMPLRVFETILFRDNGTRCTGKLWRSLTDINRNTLICERKLAHGYFNLFKPIQFLSYDEEAPPKLYHHKGLFSHEEHGVLVSSFKSRIGMENYIAKEPSGYIVSNDLSVTPYSITSNISILNGLGVPLSDVREIELNIGPQQALKILEASLSSKTALTDALRFSKTP